MKLASVYNIVKYFFVYRVLVGLSLTVTVDTDNLYIDFHCQLLYSNFWCMCNVMNYLNCIPGTITHGLVFFQPVNLAAMKTSDFNTN